jgi:hypothetical protein
MGTIGSRASSQAAFAAVPGTGFFPFPDQFFQFDARKKDKIIEAIREVIEDDAKERKDEDRPLVWHEERICDRIVFWKDPSADRIGGLSPVTYRTVLFFDGEEKPEDDEGDWSGRPLRLVVAQTSTWAEDAVANWDSLTSRKRTRVAIPSSKKAHWQAKVMWRRIYALAQPYLCLMAGTSEDTKMPPTAEELGEALTDSTVNVRIELSRLQATHRGPIPIGAVYVPAVTAMSLGGTADPGSEASRERIACRHLRVLYHHAKLFKKDYGRWPATVAELDGYVDFASHSYLLRLRPQERGFAESFVSVFTGPKEREGDEEEEEEEAIEDSLYEIEWTPTDWKLKFREDEFKDYLTIYIDTEGEIHRVPKLEQQKREGGGTGADGERSEKAAAL